MKHYSDLTPINLGGGTDVSIRELAELIKTVVGFTGDLCFDSNKPDGMPLKALDASPLLVLGWQAKTSLQAAIAETYRWWLQNSTL
jgi:GDP-L-fucose synthase